MNFTPGEGTGPTTAVGRVPGAAFLAMNVVFFHEIRVLRSLRLPNLGVFGVPARHGIYNLAVNFPNLGKVNEVFFQALMTPTKVIFAGSVTRPTAEKALFHWVFCRPRDLTRRLVRLLSVPSSLGKIRPFVFQALENAPARRRKG